MTAPPDDADGAEPLQVTLFIGRSPAGLEAVPNEVSNLAA
jgi:hypothetical protein